MLGADQEDFEPEGREMIVVEDVSQFSRGSGGG